MAKRTKDMDRDSTTEAVKRIRLSRAGRGLNRQQRSAVEHREGPLLVVAGAGTGKTRVIERRTLHLVNEGVDPRSILLLTFTNAAAETMLKRVGKRDKKCLSVAGGTFHSFAAKIVLLYAKHLDLNPGFMIWDQQDTKRAIEKRSELLGFSGTGKTFIEPGDLVNIISLSFNLRCKVKEVLASRYRQFMQYEQPIRRIRKEYREYKRSSGALDFDDLLRFLRKLLKERTIAKEICRKYEYIMVDEYQDVTAVQADIVYRLAKECHNNVVVVGDDAQNIYGFGGASSINLEKFKEKFTGCREIVLRENYRSTQRILDLANALTANMPSVIKRQLESAREGTGSKPVLVACANAYQQAAEIVKTIIRLEGEEIPYSKQAVLYRSSPKSSMPGNWNSIDMKSHFVSTAGKDLTNVVTCETSSLT